MAIALTCPGCGGTHNIEEAHLGRTAKCGCGTRFKLAKPAPAAEQAKARQELADESPRSNETRENPYAAPPPIPSEAAISAEDLPQELEEGEIPHLDAVDVVARSHRTFMRRPLAILGLTAGLSLISGAIGALHGMTQGGMHLHYGWIGVVGFPVVITFFNIWISLVQAFGVLDLCRGKPLSGLRVSLRPLPHLLVLAVIVGAVITVIGTLLCGSVGLLFEFLFRNGVIGIGIGAVPAIALTLFLGLIFSQSPLLIIDRRVGALRALAQSKQITYGNRGALLLIALTQLGLTIVTSLLGGLCFLIGVWPAAIVPGIAMLFYLLPLMMVMPIIAYLDLSSVLGPVDDPVE